MIIRPTFAPSKEVSTKNKEDKIKGTLPFKLTVERE